VKDVDEVKILITKFFKDCRSSVQKIKLTEALGRVTAKDIYVADDIPGFDRSTVDGYAVMAKDTFGASESIPAQLLLLPEIRMGIEAQIKLDQGSAAYVPTGGQLPDNADAVVMIEYTDSLGDGYIYVNKPVSPGNNVIYKGDDAKRGNVVLHSETMLRSKDIGALAAAGICEVEVKSRIRVGIISTGDEIIDINGDLSGAKVRDVNSYSLFASVLELGGEPKLYGIVPDDYDTIRDAADLALYECDIVLISGGSSVGTLDKTSKVIESFGSPGIFVHGIAMKPGKPTIIAKVRDKAVFGMPGHPVSAYFIFKVFVAHLFDVLNEQKNQIPKEVKANVAFNYPSNNGREEYVPVRLERVGEKYLAYPVFAKSGLITTLTSAQGFIRIARGIEGIASGQEVIVILF